MVGAGCAVGCSPGGFRGSPAPGGEPAPHVATRSSGVVFGCFQKLRGDGYRVIVLLGTVASHWAHCYPIPKPGVLRQLEACVSHCVWRPAGSSG